MSPDIHARISETVAKLLNENRPNEIGAALNSVIPANASLEERAGSLDQAVIYSLVAEQPGYPEDGRPGYLPSSANLKASVLDEIQAMIRADFDKEEHRKVWESLAESVRNTPEGDFEPGVTVNCPDDYLLTLDRHTCGELLRELNILPAWA